VAFMEPQYYGGRVAEIETLDGQTHYMPQDVWDDLETDALEEAHATVEAVYIFPAGHRILSRLSAPGYMDCTDWTPHKSMEAAREAFRQDGIDPDTGDPLDE
jgi:hypothetical protein